MDSVAFETTAIGAYPSRVQWDASAVDLVATMLERWHLTAGEAFVGGEAASVLRVTTRDGRPAVLKVGFPHVEAVWEAVALESWGGRLAPEVLRQDPWTWSILLELVEPGIPLSRHELPAEEALTIAAGLYRELLLTKPPPGLPTLADIVSEYARDAQARLPGQRHDLVNLGVLDLVERGLSLSRDLAASDGASTMLHGDFNPGNLISAADGGWRVIDPKPMLGDPEFELFPLIEQLGSPWTRRDPAAALWAQLELASRIAGVDPVRTARWAFARAAYNVCWYLDDANDAAATAAARELPVWFEISGS
ncbi:MAG: aminoglycoside phosphotransferase [Rhodoglobus sp.]|nr:aminoglycoside phosphotransferase [Rhodoglobus sp.]